MVKSYTISQVAKICDVAPRTAANWFDKGRLKGYRIPGSRDRRVPHQYLIEFLQSHGMEALIPNVETFNDQQTPKRSEKTC